MNNWLEKWRGSDDQALSPERRLMKEALARLDQVKKDATPPMRLARLAFILDLTGSRSASLENARIATVAMFDTLKAIGAITVKMIYFRGAKECKASAWETDPSAVSRTMEHLDCEIGQTQIARALRQVLSEREPVAAVVYVGDHCEDHPDELIGLAQGLGARSMPLYVFHECADHDERSLRARPTFQRIAEASGGVYCEFRPDAGKVLRELLASVAAFSAAGTEGVKQTPLPQTHAAQQLHSRLLLGPGDGPPAAKKR
jgi:hypothetical protein